MNCLVTFFLIHLLILFPFSRERIAFAQSQCSLGWEGSIIIDGESLTNWAVEADTGSSGSLQLVEGINGHAVQLIWDMGEGEWVQGKYTFPQPMDLSNADIFGISLNGGGIIELPNTVSIMFADVNDIFYGFNMEGKNKGINQIDRWLINLPIPKKILYFFFSFGTQTQIDWSRINRFFFVVKRPGMGLGGGTGRLTMDLLQWDKAEKWPRQGCFETAVTNVQVSSKTIHYMLSQQVPATGLFISWKEEEQVNPPPKAYLYDQALVLIALTREGVWENGAPVNSASQGAKGLADFLIHVQKTDGHWARCWNPKSGEELSDDRWVGDQAWCVMALSIYSGKSGDPSAMSSAQNGAQWLASQIDPMGKVVASTEGNVDVWWAMISTSRFSDAERIKNYLLDENMVWDPELQYWWRGYQDPVVAMDAATWLSAFARHPLVNQPEKGKAALSFVKRTLITCSDDRTLRGFDGMGPVSIWNEGTAQYIAAGGEDAQTFLNMLISQQNPDGSMPGSPDDWSCDAFGWLTPWSGLAPTAWLYFALEGLPFFDIARGPIPGIASSSPYCFFYGKWNDCVISEVVKKFKLVILHPGIEEPNITPNQVTQLKGKGVVVIGYVPFGEDYKSTRPGDERGPVYFDSQNCTLVYGNRGVASWYVDEVDAEGMPSHDGIPDLNPTFKSAFVNAGDPDWQDFIRNATISLNGFAGTNYILDYLGCDGLFIDVIETASPWLPYHYTWRGMFDLLDRISNLYPGKYMVVNRPLFACYPEHYPIACCTVNHDSCCHFCFCDFFSPIKARDEFRKNVNAFTWESYSLDRAYNDFPETRGHIVTCSDNSDGCGFNVLVLDYHNIIHSSYQCMDYQIREVMDLDWLDYIATGPLYQMGYWVYNYLNNLPYPLLDRHFNDWQPWNVFYCRPDPSGDIPKADADILDIAITHDPDYLYFRIHFQDPILEGFLPNFYQIFLDSNDISPGYRGSGADWKGEFGYLWENGKLYLYAGSGLDWIWEEIPETASLSSYAIGIEDKTYMEVALLRCTIGAKEIQGEATKVLFNVFAFDLYQNDRAPDDPSQGYYLYEYKPLIQIDGNIQDWEDIPTDFGNTFSTATDKSGDVIDCGADIIRSYICSDLSNIYFRLDLACSLPQPLWGSHFYQVFIDTDQNASTGYSSCQWRIGAEYLWENGQLYKHNGENCDWSWKWLTNTGYAIETWDDSKMEIAIPRTQIQVPLCLRSMSEELPLRFVCRVVLSGGIYIDSAPDSLENHFYTWPFTNHPPCLPGSPSPPDGAINISVSPNLSWEGSDPDSGDMVTYDIYFDTQPDPQTLFPDQNSTSFSPPEGLEYFKTYYWQVVAKDNHGEETTGPVWCFTTKWSPYCFISTSDHGAYSFHPFKILWNLWLMIKDYKQTAR